MKVIIRYFSRTFFQYSIRSIHFTDIHQPASIIEELQDLLAGLSLLCHALGAILAHADAMPEAASLDRKRRHLVFISSVILDVNKAARKCIPSRGCRSVFPVVYKR